MSNLPAEYKEGILFKLKRFINKIALIFKKEKTLQKKTINEINVNNSFKESLQEDIKEQRSVDECIEFIEKHSEELYNLSLEKLEKINLIYDKKIAQNEEEINSLIKEIESIDLKCIKLAQQ